MKELDMDLRFMRPLAVLLALLTAAFPVKAQPDPEPDPCLMAGQAVPLQAPGTTCSTVSGVAWVPPSGGVAGHYEWRTVPPVPFIAMPATDVQPTPLPIYISSAWWTFANDLVTHFDIFYTYAHLEDGYAQGGRLGVNLLASPSPGDFLCPAPTLGGREFSVLDATRGSSLSNGVAGRLSHHLGRSGGFRDRAAFGEGD